MLLVPVHSKVIVEAKSISAGLDGKVVRSVVEVDAITIARPDEGEIGRQSVGEDVAPT